MGYRRYERYKDSSVEWIGEIPEEWSTKKLKYITIITMGQSPKSEDYNTDGIGKPFLQGNAEFTDFYPIPKYYCPTATKFSKPNDILLSVRAPVGAMNISDSVYGIGRGLCAITAREINMKYLWYALSICLEELRIKSKGSTYDAITVADVSNLLMLLPSEKEQIAIATFLDQKTAEIDSLIADKEKLIQLLQEKRQAIITEAVTKGLDPNVPMKDSGVEWIGEIPEHWEVSKVKYETEINRCTLSENTDEDYQINYIDISNVNSIGEIINIQEFAFRDAPSRARRIVREGDTIISTVRTYLKAIAYCESLPINCICSTGFAVLTPKKNVHKKYLYYLMRSEIYVNQIMRYSVGVSYPAINATDIGNLEFLMPPLIEQEIIADFLDQRTAEIDSLIADIQTQIAKLKEYRQSLIYEAVTGKIDVRDFTPNPEGVVLDA